MTKIHCVDIFISMTKIQKEALKKAFKDIDVKKLAKELGTSTNYVWNIKYGLASLSWKRALLIEQLSEGKLPRQLLLPDIPWTKE